MSSFEMKMYIPCLGKITILMEKISLICFVLKESIDFVRVHSKSDPNVNTKLLILKQF